MLKKYFFISLLAFSLLLMPRAHAQTDPLLKDVVTKSYGASAAAANSLTLSQTVGQIIKTALGLVGIVFLVLTVYAGFLWMTAAGEEEKVTKAISIIKTSVIGLVIVLAAYSITYFVMFYLAQATA